MGPTPLDQTNAAAEAGSRRLPPWLRVNLPILPAQATFNLTESAVATGGLHTVCEEAKCPNIHDCWARGTATFMVAGQSCTRGCRFCSVQTVRMPELPDANEPARLADAVERLKLDHVVITVVNRDDLPDGGAAHYRACVDAVAQRTPGVGVELLSSDLAGDQRALAKLLEGAPLSVFAHNIECVERLTATVRDPRANFPQSLAILTAAKRLRPDVLTKSSIMLGFGELDREIESALVRLREADVDIVTLGQYLTPGRAGERFLPVTRFIPPAEFEAWAVRCHRLGFSAVASGPLVRSSYRAATLAREARAARLN